MCFDIVMEGGPQLKGALAKRLGGFVDSFDDQTSMPPQKCKSPCLHILSWRVFFASCLDWYEYKGQEGMRHVLGFLCIPMM